MVTQCWHSAKEKDPKDRKGKLSVWVYCTCMAVQNKSSEPKARARRKNSTTEWQWPATWEIGVSRLIDETYCENGGDLEEMVTETNGPAHMLQQPWMKESQEEENNSQQGPHRPRNREGGESDWYTMRKDHWIHNNQGFTGDKGSNTQQVHWEDMVFTDTK